jgi:hypothetical protein
LRSVPHDFSPVCHGYGFRAVREEIALKVTRLTDEPAVMADNA